MGGRKLSKKIDLLFEYRMLPWMLQLSNIKRRKAFLTRMKRLQTAIYALDHTLETTWMIAKDQLQDDWKEINRHLKNFELSKREREGYCQGLKQYQKHELRLRDGKTPLDLPMLYLYFYKSCDVKLMRNLIYHHADELEVKVSPRDWLTFDLVTELNDDIEDLFEDIHTYNGNRLVFEIAQKGPKQAKKNYEEFIRDIMRDYQQDQLRENTVEQKIVVANTLKVGRETLSLLKQQFKRDKIKKLSGAKVLRKHKSAK